MNTEIISYPNSDKLFNYLTNQSRSDYPDFSTYTQNEFSQYWLFSDIYNFFGPNITGQHRYIEKTLKDAIIASTPKNLDKGIPKSLLNFENLFDAHVELILNDYYINTPEEIKQKKNGLDAKLSRYAFWCIAKQHPNMIFTELYLMNPTFTHDQVCFYAYHLSRIHLRDKLSKLEKTINGIAYKHKIDLNAFHREQENVFFCDNNPKSIESFYRRKRELTGSILNHIGQHSLRARITALKNAINYYDSQKEVNFQKFYNFLLNELRTQRNKLYCQKNIFPSEEIYTFPITDLKKELKEQEKIFIREFITLKLR